MSTEQIENKTNQKNNLLNISSFFIENREKSNEDIETTSTDSDVSFNGFSIIAKIASILDIIVARNEEENSENSQFHYEGSLFAHKKIPKISIEDYLNRIQKYSKLEDSTLVIALIYIDRLLSNQNIELSKYNVHRILLAAILAAIKYNEDEIYDNYSFAKIFAVSSKELNKLENKFLDLIEFKLFVSDEIFQLYYDKI